MLDKVDIGQLKQEISKLVKKYRTFKLEKSESALRELSEANVRKDFIDPLFEILGWTVRDSNEYDAEKYVRGAGYADVTIKLNGSPVIFVEAKRFGGVPSRAERGVQTTLEGLKVYADWTEEERQVLNYAGMNVDVKWAVLTNFEKFRLFNAKTGDTVLNIESPDEYLERIDDLVLLTKRNVANGFIDKLETRIERPDVDLAFLNLMNDWRLKLARNICKNCPELLLDDIKRHVQRILDRLIIVRYAEDRWILSDPDQLMASYRYWQQTKTYTKLTEILKNLFIGFDKIYDSKIFERNDKLDRVIDRIDSDVLGEIIRELYQQSFRKFDSDILGNTYESYLAHDLTIRNGVVDLTLNPELRKAGGIYYTPTYVVEFIVKNTLGIILEKIWREVERLLDRKRYAEALNKFREITKIRSLDPACGSGSFLIKAFSLFKEYYEGCNHKVEQVNELITNEISELRKQGRNKEAWELESLRPQNIEGYEKSILGDNIHGVDLDPRAAEIASVNLMLQALKRGERLPLILYDNIKVGNSVISGTEENLAKFFGENWHRKKPFNWDAEFSFDEENLSVVIGNPPWIESKKMDKSDKEFYSSCYASTKKQYDIFNAFVERGISLLKESGLLGFILPNRFIMNPDYEPFRRYLLAHTKILQICDIGEGVFAGVEMPACILILGKCMNESERNANIIKVRINVKDLKEQVWTEYQISQGRFLTEPMYLFTIYEPEEIKTITKKMEKVGNPFRELVSNARGVEIGKNNPLISSEPKDRSYVPFLVGEDIDRYVILNHRYLKTGATDVDYKSPELYSAEKIIVRKTGTGIRATYDDSGYYVIQVIYIFKSKDSDLNIKYLLGLLNSKLISFYHYSKFGEKEKRVFPHLRQESLLRLPMKVPNMADENEKYRYHRIINLVDAILKLSHDFYQIPTKLDQFLEPIISYDKLRIYLNRLSPENKQFLNSELRGKVRKIYADELGDWLTIYVNCENQERKTLTKVGVLKVRIFDLAIRQFILHVIRNYRKPLGSGNISAKLLAIKIPRFNKNPEKNKEAIERIINGYLQTMEKRKKLEAKIAETDSAVNKEVYNLYGLTADEIKLVESST